MDNPAKMKHISAAKHWKDIRNDSKMHFLDKEACGECRRKKRQKRVPDTPAGCVGRPGEGLTAHQPLHNARKNSFTLKAPKKN